MHRRTSLNIRLNMATVGILIATTASFLITMQTFFDTTMHPSPRHLSTQFLPPFLPDNKSSESSNGVDENKNNSEEILRQKRKSSILSDGIFFSGCVPSSSNRTAYDLSHGNISAVMVHIGNSIEYGRHSLLSLSQLRRMNPSLHIVWIVNKDLLHNNPEAAAAAECYSVEMVFIEDLEKNSTDLMEFQRVFYISGNMDVPGNAKEFNFRTSARIVYVLAYMKSIAVKEMGGVFHLENDNLAYVPLHHLADAIDSCNTMASGSEGRGVVACGRRSSTELALGFMYIQNHAALQEIVDFWTHCYSMEKKDLQMLFLQHMSLANYEWINDMSLSQLYHAIHSKEKNGILQILPSSSSSSGSPLQSIETCVFERYQHITDVGNIAIWHMGDFQDAVPHSNQEAWGAYQVFDPRPFSLEWRLSPLTQCTFPVLSASDSMTTAFNVSSLHIHSKRLSLHVSGCLSREDQRVSYHDGILSSVDEIERSEKLHTSMYGNANIHERLGAPGRHRGDGAWEVNGKDRRPSFPFISGDGFRSICAFRCDFVSPECNIDHARLLDGDCVFVEMVDYGSQSVADGTKYLKHFVESVLPTIAVNSRRVVVITHNGDSSAPDSDRELWYKDPAERPLYRYAEVLQNSPSIIRWFASNCFWFTKDMPSKLTCIPIGIENRMWSQPGRYIDAMKKIKKNEGTAADNKEMLFFGHWRIHRHADASRIPEREQASQELMNAAGWGEETTGYEGGSWDKWAHAVSRHHFVACPWGNGLDTHRVWEVLLLGSFPVVRTSTLDSLFEALPVLIVKEWADVNRTLLERTYIKFTESTNIRMEKILMPYWINKIRISQHTRE